MKTAFVTGGSGYVGRNLLRRLAREGVAARALARSESAAATVQELGAEIVRGNLSDRDALCRGAEGCDTVFHCAAKVDEWGPTAEFDAINAEGTRNVVAAAEQAGARRLVHVSTEAVLAGGPPLIGVNEDTPLPRKPAGDYARTKGLAEALVRQASIPWVIVRPRFIWGGDDTTLIPTFAKAVQEGRFAWIGDGEHLTSTCHIDNLVQALWLAATHPEAHGCYFVTDGEPVPFRPFLIDMMATAGVTLPTRRVPRGLAAAVALVSEAAWRFLPLGGKPPVTRLTVALLGYEVTIDDRRIREQLGFRNVVDRTEGLARLAANPRPIATTTDVL